MSKTVGRKMGQNNAKEIKSNKIEYKKILDGQNQTKQTRLRIGHTVMINKYILATPPPPTLLQRVMYARFK